MAPDFGPIDIMKPTHRPSRFKALLGYLLAAGAALLISYSPLALAQAKLIHTEPSTFAPVLVFEEYGERCMNFNSMEDTGRQTCFDLQAPDKMVFSYTRMMTSALFLNPAPKNVLIVGLGGATLPRALERILPDAVIDTVEIDPAVGRVAEQYFGYRQGPRQRLFVEDGRAFVERAQREGRQYGMVMLDAFDVDYIPPHLLTVEFLQHVRAILAPDGVLVANTFTRSRMYDRESATYAEVFGDFFNLRSGNRVIIASRSSLPDDEILARNAGTLAKSLAPFGIDVDRELRRFSRHRDWNQDAAVITDKEIKSKE
jgi:spermidine synthase